jgi:hypothetical protein
MYAYQSPCASEISAAQKGEILSSIIRQLAEQCWPLPAELRAFYDRYHGKARSPPLEERVSLIRALAYLFTKTYILIDALVTPLRSLIFRSRDQYPDN